MSHEIFEKMFYSQGEPAWHGLGVVSDTPMSAVGILNTHFSGGYSIDLRQPTVTLNGIPTPLKDKFAIVRTPYGESKDEVIFDFCTDRFHPLQPKEIAECFDKNVVENVETMAFLKEGREMFISWNMPSCEIRTGDEIKMFGIVRSGFDTLKGTRLFTSIYRPVCWNTITMAQDWAKHNTDKASGKGELWSGKAVNKNLLRDLGYWMAHVQGNAKREVNLLKDFFGTLAKTPIKNDVEAHRILYEAYPPVSSVSASYPKELQAEREKKTVSINEIRSDIRDGIYKLFAGAGTAITPDYWGMLNSTTEYFCHYQPSKRPVAESIMFGGRHDNMMRMVEVLSDRV